MIYKNGSTFKYCLGELARKPVVAGAVLFLIGVAPSLLAQGLTPSTPAKEYVYFGPQLVAIQQAGMGGMMMGQAVKVGSASTTATTVVTSSNLVKPGPLPPSKARPAAVAAPAAVDLAKTTPSATHAALSKKH